MKAAKKNKWGVLIVGFLAIPTVALYWLASRVESYELKVRFFMLGLTSTLVLICQLLPVRNARSIWTYDVWGNIFETLRKRWLWGAYLLHTRYVIALVCFVAVFFDLAKERISSSSLIWVAFALVFIPYVVGCVMWLCGKREPNAMCSLGFVRSYVLTPDTLYYCVCRSIPVYRISFRDVARVDIWRQIGHYSYGSSDNGALFFFFNKVWFWPKPLIMSMRRMFKAHAERFEYVLVLKNKRSVVIAAEKAFIRALEKAVRDSRERGANECISKQEELMGPLKSD